MDILTQMKEDMASQQKPEASAEPAAAPAAPLPETSAAPVEPPAALAATDPAAAATTPATSPAQPDRQGPDYKRAFDAMRYENKALKEQLRELVKKQAEFTEKFDKRIPEPAKPQPPDLTQDPVGNIDYKLTELFSRFGTLEDHIKKQYEEHQQRAHYERTMGTIAQIDEYGRQQHGDRYYSALQHIVNAQAYPREMAGMDKQDAQREATAEIAQYALRLAQSGQNPVELIMNYAAQIGFNPQPAAAPQAPASAPQPPVDRQAEKTRQAVAAGKSASAGGAGANGKAFTAADIDAMYDESPHRLADFKRQHPDVWEKYMHGKL